MEPRYPFYLYWGNAVYRHAYGLYRPLYWTYKRMSDRRLIRMLEHHLRPGMTALDVGANVGFYSDLISRLVGEKGAVHCFEPEPQNFERLRRAMKGRKNVVINPVAAAEKEGAVTLYLSGGLNIDHHTYDDGAGRKPVEVACTSIDGYFKSGERVDLIKMDIQGAEYHALLGMRHTIRRSANVTLFSEFWPYGLKKAGIDPEKYLNLIRSLGFSIRFSHSRHASEFSSKTGEHRFCSQIFCFRTGGKPS